MKNAIVIEEVMDFVEWLKESPKHWGLRVDGMIVDMKFHADEDVRDIFTVSYKELYHAAARHIRSMYGVAINDGWNGECIPYNVNEYLCLKWEAEKWRRSSRLNAADALANALAWAEWANRYNVDRDQYSAAVIEFLRKEEQDLRPDPMDDIQMEADRLCGIRDRWIA